MGGRGALCCWRRRRQQLAGPCVCRWRAGGRELGRRRWLSAAAAWHTPTHPPTHPPGSTLTTSPARTVAVATSSSSTEEEEAAAAAALPGATPGSSTRRAVSGISCARPRRSAAASSCGRWGRSAGGGGRQVGAVGRWARQVGTVGTGAHKGLRRGRHAGA
jgi:hypothetical protein